MSKSTGLGNAYYATDVPGSAPIAGVQAGVTLLDGRLGIEAQFRNGFSSLRSGNGSAQILGIRGQVLWNFAPEASVVRPYVVAGYGQEGLTTGRPACGSNAKTQPANCVHILSPDWDNGYFLGAGLKVPLSYRFSLRGDVRWLGADGRPAVAGQAGSGTAVANNLEVQLGVSYTFGGRPEDSDKDGIPDDLDKCPNEPEDKDGFEDSDGCPDLDNDGDGIPDDQDKCPNEAEDKDGFQDGDGCPDPDNDGDGIPDVKDKCPDKPETKNGFQDEDGCPDVLDSDGDGIPDNKDKCPKEKEDKDGYQDEDGCPEPDNDGDGIPDNKDKCPNQPENRNGINDEDGCPDEVPPAVAKLLAGPITTVGFKGAVMQKGADAVFEPLLELLLEHDKLQAEITVSPLDSGANGKTLAEQRALALRDWFEGKGIEPGRLFAVAAVAGNDTPNKAEGKGVVNPKITIKLLLPK